MKIIRRIRVALRVLSLLELGAETAGAIGVATLVRLHMQALD